MLDVWMREHQTAAAFLVGDMNDQLDDSPSVNVFGPLLDASGGYCLPTLSVAEHSYIPFPRPIDHVILTSAAEQSLPTTTARAVPLDESIDRKTDRVSDHRPVET